METNKLNLPPVNIIIRVAKKERWAKAGNVSIEKKGTTWASMTSFIFFLTVKRCVT